MTDTTEVGAWPEVKVEEVPVRMVPDTRPGVRANGMVLPRWQDPTTYRFFRWLCPCGRRGLAAPTAVEAAHWGAEHARIYHPIEEPD